MYVCEGQRKATKVGSTATVSRTGVLIISHITFRDCRVHSFCDNLSRNSCISGAAMSRRRGVGKRRRGGSDVRGREREKVSPNQALPFGMSDT